MVVFLKNVKWPWLLLVFAHNLAMLQRHVLIKIATAPYDIEAQIMPQASHR